MAYEELDDAALEKLAWIIAEEFVDSRELLGSLMTAEPEQATEKRKSLQRISLTWWTPACLRP